MLTYLMMMILVFLRLMRQKDKMFLSQFGPSEVKGTRRRGVAERDVETDEGEKEDTSHSSASDGRLPSQEC